MADLDLDAIEARANAATEGPWESGHEWHEPGTEVFQVTCDAGQVADTKFWPAYQDGGDRLPVACANAHFIAHARTDVPALVAALREARAEVERWEADFPCDEGCRDYPEGTCSRHGRRPADLWERVEFFARERDDWRRRYEALRDGVTEFADRLPNSVTETLREHGRNDVDSLLRPVVGEVCDGFRAVVARVEES